MVKKLRSIILISFIVILFILIIICVPKINNKDEPDTFKIENEPDILKIVNKIESSYGNKLYFNTNPFYEKNIGSISQNLNYDLNATDYDKIIDILNVIDYTFSTINENLYNQLPDIYFCSSGEVHGLAYRSQNENFIVLNINQNNYKFTIYHELFHIFTTERKEDGKYKYLTDNLKKGFYEAFSRIEEDRSVVSEYATTSLSECMADAFAASILRKDDNEYFSVMREYAYPTILNKNFIDKLQADRAS